MPGLLLRSFFLDEQGQASIEYYILVGAAILAAVMFASTYGKIGAQTGKKYMDIINTTQNETCRDLETYLKLVGGENVTIC